MHFRPKIGSRENRILVQVQDFQILKIGATLCRRSTMLRVGKKHFCFVFGFSILQLFPLEWQSATSKMLRNARGNFSLTLLSLPEIIQEVEDAKPELKLLPKANVT